MLEIRAELQKDFDAVREVNFLAFKQSAEGNIVDKLRIACREILSLVAVYDGKIVGHILFSPVKIKSRVTEITGMGLAPMAVLPDFQNRGIGSALVNEGIRRIKETGCPFIVVLGHPHFYPRFTFERASIHRLKSQWESVPDEAFMVMILDKSLMDDISGVVEYRYEFNEAM